MEVGRRLRQQLAPQVDEPGVADRSVDGALRPRARAPGEPVEGEDADQQQIGAQRDRVGPEVAPGRGRREEDGGLREREPERGPQHAEQGACPGSADEGHRDDGEGDDEEVGVLILRRADEEHVDVEVGADRAHQQVDDREQDGASIRQQDQQRDHGQQDERADPGGRAGGAADRRDRDVDRRHLQTDQRGPAGRGGQGAGVRRPGEVAGKAERHRTPSAQGGPTGRRRWDTARRRPPSGDYGSVPARCVPRRDGALYPRRRGGRSAPRHAVADRAHPAQKRVG